VGVRLKKKTVDSRTSSSPIMRVQIGDVCCAITCHDREVFGYLGELYRGFLSDRPADITIKLEVVGQFSSLETRLALSQGRVLWGGDHIAALYRPFGEASATANKTVSVTIERPWFDPRLDFKIMNLLLPPSYYTVNKVEYHDGPLAMLVHSCGILRRERILLFAGPSEAGKTTVARLCGDEYGQVVNDEMLLISGSGLDGGTVKVQGVPIVGGVAQRLNVKAPLACVLMLKQAERTTIRRLSRLEAYLRFMRQVIAPRGFDSEHNDNRTMLLQATRFSDWVTKTVPGYELQFTLDREQLWGVVAELEKSLRKGELVA
jgi:hypothetical protein